MESQLNSNLTDLVCFALHEYVNRNFYKKELMGCGHIRQSFGCLTANISAIAVTKNDIYSRQYNVQSEDGNFRISFILGHAAMLFSWSSHAFREELLNTTKIKGVITLKQSIFSTIGIPAAIIILNGDDSETWFTSAENTETLVELLKGNLQDSQTVFYSSNISPESLLPEFYNGDDKLVERRFEGTEIKKLGEIAEVINGKGAKKDVFSETGIPYLRARNIQNGQIIQPNDFIDKECIATFSRQLIQEGDILLTKFFGQNKLAFVTVKDIPAIAGNGLFIIRPFNIPEGYLFNYLTSNTGNEIFNKQLKRVQKDVTVPSVNLADLKEIDVPIFEQDIMQSIENIDSISKNEAIETSKKLVKKINSTPELKLKVKNDLIAAGWEKANFVNGFNRAIPIGPDNKWNPDYTYIMPDGRKVIIEVKSDIIQITPEWVNAVKYILSIQNNYIFILSTGTYYEIHFSGVLQSINLVHPPTINQILQLEKETR